MPALTIKNVIHVLGLMEECENAMAELYRTASKIWRDERDTWQDLSGQETRHALYVREILGLISNNPGQYRPGRPVTPETANAFLARIRTVIEDLNKGRLSKSSFISLVLDFEERMIELNFTQIVITDNESYKNLAREIISETAAHRALLASLKKTSGR